MNMEEKIPKEWPANTDSQICISRNFFFFFVHIIHDAKPYLSSLTLTGVYESVLRIWQLRWAAFFERLAHHSFPFVLVGTVKLFTT